MKKVLFVLIISIFSCNVFGQFGWNKHFPSLTGTNYIHEMVIANEKLYLQSIGFCANWDTCSALIEMNTEGDILNSYYLNEGAYRFSYVNSMLADGNRLINLATSYLVDTFYNGTISSFDLNSLTFQHKKITNKKNYFEPTSIIKCKGSKDFIVLSQIKYNNEQFEHVGLSILDSMLNIIKDTILNKDFHFCFPSDIYQDSDSSFRYFVNGCKYDECKDGNFIYSFRINKKGEIISTLKIGRPIHFGWGYPLVAEPAQDGNIIFTWKDSLGYATNTDETYVCKIDKEGKELWKTNFKLDLSSGQSKPVFEVLSLINGDYLLLGGYYSKMYGEKNNFVAWAVRLSQNGQILWERSYYYNFPKHIKFISSSLELHDGLEGEDGSIYLCGGYRDTIIGVSTQSPKMNNWVMKLNPDGCLIPDCSDGFVLAEANEINLIKNIPLVITPNLSNNYISISCKDIFFEPAKIIISNVQGQIIESIDIGNNYQNKMIDITRLVNGMYFCSISGDNWQSVPVKFVKY